MAFALTLSELAQWIDGDIIRGGLDLSLTGMAALDGAAPGDVSFLGNEKYYAQFLATKAAAVIVPRGVTSGPEGTALIAVDNPSLAFAVVTIFAILLYVPAFKAAVKRVTGGAGAAARALIGRGT